MNRAPDAAAAKGTSALSRRASNRERQARYQSKMRQVAGLEQQLVDLRKRLRHKLVQEDNIDAALVDCLLAENDRPQRDWVPATILGKERNLRVRRERIRFKKLTFDWLMKEKNRLMSLPVTDKAALEKIFVEHVMAVKDIPAFPPDLFTEGFGDLDDDDHLIL